jgi:hypothetical protein
LLITKAVRETRNYGERKRETEREREVSDIWADKGPISISVASVIALSSHIQQDNHLPKQEIFALCLFPKESEVAG